MRARGDGGETLIEILLTVVIIGLTVTALISSLATAGNAGNVQRISVEADVVMRNSAEATRAAAAEQCRVGVRSYHVTYPSLPPDFTVFPEPSDDRCPPVNATQMVTLTVTGPLGFRDTMDVTVRSP